MMTEYQASARLIFWGDSLQPENISKVVKIDVNSCEHIICGEEINRRNDKITLAKTGRWSYTVDRDLPDLRRDPQAQLEFLYEKINGAKVNIIESGLAEAGEIQLSLYYQNVVPGENEADFFVPTEFARVISQQGIRLRVTVLP